ncbi:MAG: ABC transporter ATP-binding protein [Tissierellales bacterium]|jgi:putative ABC transport system ATP-binding protein|nr:ABC transporter ATP-binding protein [Tissierellales bacterium]
MSEYILKTKDLKKYYGSGENEVRALDGIDLKIKRGEFVAVVGTSGSGKTTLLNMLGGLDYPTDGEITVENQNIRVLDEEKLTVFRRRNIGFIFQNYNLVPVLSAWNNVTLPIGLDGQMEDKDFINDIFSTLGMVEKKEKLPSELSGGQQQRVAIARALATKPALILADEPTGNLDQKNSQEVMMLLKMANQKFSQTTIMITHDEAMAQLCDRVIHIEDGKIVDDKNTDIGYLKAKEVKKNA